MQGPFIIRKRDDTGSKISTLRNVWCCILAMQNDIPNSKNVVWANNLTWRMFIYLQYYICMEVGRFLGKLCLINAGQNCIAAKRHFEHLCLLDHEMNRLEFCMHCFRKQNYHAKNWGLLDTTPRRGSVGRSSWSTYISAALPCCLSVCLWTSVLLRLVGSDLINNERALLLFPPLLLLLVATSIEQACETYIHISSWQTSYRFPVISFTYTS